MAGYSVLHSPLLGEEKVDMRPRRTGENISRVSLGQVAKRRHMLQLFVDLGPFFPLEILYFIYMIFSWAGTKKFS